MWPDTVVVNRHYGSWEICAAIAKLKGIEQQLAAKFLEEE